VREELKLLGVEGQVLRRVFVHETEVLGGWTELYSEKRHDVYASQNVIWMITSRSVKWQGMWSHIRKNRNT
jgi:hypothetical protein